jgi:hypothetical protein
MVYFRIGVNPTFARFGKMIGGIRVLGNGKAEKSSKPL